MEKASSKKNYRELWIPDLIVLCLIVIISFVLFHDKKIDIWAARFFYHPENVNAPWFEAKFFWWNLLYHSANFIGGVLIVACLIVLFLAHFWPDFRKFRIYALYIFLVMSLGSGLLVNTFFKPYWGRPRPREVLELGGKREYRPFYAIGLGLPGKSFPCGHCTVCFTYSVFWWIFRRKNRLIGYTSLILSTGIGVFMGMARMADGGHFFSDILWAGLIIWFTGFILYYFLLKIPEQEDNPHYEISLVKLMNQILDGKKVLVYSIFGILLTVTMTLFLLASPYYKELNSVTPLMNISILNINIDTSDIDFKIDPNLEKSFIISGTAKGFGFPGNDTLLNCITGKVSSDCIIRKSGFFTDYESNLKIIVNPKLVNSLNLNLAKGNISLINKNDIPKTYKFISN